MIRKNDTHRPLYRDIVKDALQAAWRERRLWPLAFFAAILQTGGIYDVIFLSVRRLLGQGHFVFQSFARVSWWQQMRALDFSSRWTALGSWGRIENLIFGLLFILILLCASILAQGALVLGLGGRVRGRPLNLQACLRAAGEAFWPIVCLNILTLGCIWISRFIVLLPLAATLEYATVASIIVSLLAFLVFAAAVIVFTSVHFFALNAIMLQGDSVWDAVRRAYHQFREVWLAVLETSVVLFVAGIVFFVAGVAAFLLMGIPLFLFLLAALSIQSLSLIAFGSILVWILLMAVMIIVGMYALTFQYAMWVRLYRRFAEGSASAKLHRFVRWLTGEYHHDLGF